MKRVKAAKKQILKQRVNICCYGTSDKTRSADPQGFSLETIHTYSESASQPRLGISCA